MNNAIRTARKTSTSLLENTNKKGYAPYSTPPTNKKKKKNCRTKTRNNAIRTAWPPPAGKTNACDVLIKEDSAAATLSKRQHKC